MISKPKYTKNNLSLGDKNYLPKGGVDDGVMVVVMEVDDEEEVGVLVELMTLVASMEMKEEEDDLGDLLGVGGCCGDGDEGGDGG